MKSVVTRDGQFLMSKELKNYKFKIVKLVKNTKLDELISCEKCRQGSRAPLELLLALNLLALIRNEHAHEHDQEDHRVEPHVLRTHVHRN